MVSGKSAALSPIGRLLQITSVACRAAAALWLALGLVTEVLAEVGDVGGAGLVDAQGVV